MLAFLKNKKITDKKILIPLLLLFFVSFFVFPFSVRSAEMTEEQTIQFLNNKITQYQQIADRAHQNNLDLVKSIEDVKKTVRWWHDQKDTSAAIAGFNRQIARNNDLITRSRDSVASAERQLQDIIIQKAKTVEEKKAAQAKYDEIAKNRRANLIKTLNETKLEGAIDNASCFTVSGGVNLGNCLMRGVGWIGNLVSWVFVLVLWLSSKVFDASIYASITMVSTWFSTDAVSLAWKTMRDIANIFFVFVLLYIAIGTIFELSGVSNPQKLVVNVIIIALLVNFSGFFVRVVVDASNVIAYEFYSSMGGGELELKTVGTEIVKRLQLDKLYIASATGDGNISSSVIVEPQINRLSFLSIIAQTFGNIFIFLATSFVLLVASILFLIRTIVLLFVYIVSPFAFMSRIIPNAKFNYFQKWVDALIKQSFFAPAFLIPLYLVLLLLGDGGISSIGGTSGTSSWAIAGGGSATIVIINAIILGLIIACIFIAQEIGAVGLGVATSFAGKANAIGTRFAGRPALRFAGGIRNATTGYIAGKLGATSAGAGVNRFGSRVGGAIWNSPTMKEIRQTKAGQKIGQAIKNPLLSANDAMGSAAGLAGVKSFNVLGSSPESRKAAKDAEKEKKAKEKKDTINNNLENSLSSMSPRTKAGCHSIISSLDKDAIKIVDPKVFVKYPEAAQALSDKQLIWINALDDAPLSGIKAAVLADAAPTGTPHDAYDFMRTGAGTWMY